MYKNAHQMKVLQITLFIKKKSLEIFYQYFFTDNFEASLQDHQPTQARRQEIPKGGSSIRIARRDAIAAWGLGPLKVPRSPGVFCAKSCNPAISRHFIG